VRQNETNFDIFSSHWKFWPPEIPLRSPHYPSNMKFARVTHTFGPVFHAIFHRNRNSSKVSFLQRRNQQSCDVLKYVPLSTANRGCSENFVYRCNTTAHPLCKCIESFVKAVYLLRVCNRTKWQLSSGVLQHLHTFDHLCCSYKMRYSNIIIEVHNYNDMAKMWTGNFVYIYISMPKW